MFGWFQKNFVAKLQLIKFWIFSGIFSIFAPITLCAPHLQSTYHYTVRHYVKVWHVRLGVANNMHPLRWEGCTNGKDPKILCNIIFCCDNAENGSILTYAKELIWNKEVLGAQRITKHSFRIFSVCRLCHSPPPPPPLVRYAPPITKHVWLQ